MSRLYIVTLLISLISRIHHAKSQNGGNSGWNQNGGRNINNLRYADDTTLVAESEEELKSLLMRVKEESEKAGLEFNIQNTKTMASGPITSWQTEGEKVEVVTDFIFLGFKSLWTVPAVIKLKDACSLKGKL